VSVSIAVKYLSATNKTGARWKATCGNGKSVTISSEREDIDAARQLLAKYYPRYEIDACITYKDIRYCSIKRKRQFR